MLYPETFLTFQQHRNGGLANCLSKTELLLFNILTEETSVAL